MALFSSPSTCDSSKNLYLFLCCCVFIASGQAQTHLNDQCILDNGKIGQCIYFKNCPAAIDIVSRFGHPINCGFEGLEPIVCCETIETLSNQPPRPVGLISKQKCNETYFGLPINAGPDPNNSSSAAAASAVETERETDDGFQEATFHTSVVGGTAAPLLKYPHMAVLGYGKWPEVHWACGGTLISHTYVLTAAHCINTQYGEVKYIRLGAVDIRATDLTAGVFDVRVVRVIKHPEFKAPSVYHDIALIEFDEYAAYNNWIRAACLHTEMEIPSNVWIATGWGATSHGGAPSPILQQVTLREFTVDDCQKSYKSSSLRRLKNGIDNALQLCAGESNKDTCQGDSGGPLQFKTPEHKLGYTIIGVTSFGKACGIGTIPAVYTRVSNYIEWIESIVWA